MRILSDAVQAGKKMRILLLLVALLYAGFYVAGWYLISVKSPIAVGTVQGLREGVLTQRPFTTIIESLREGNLGQAILFTFLWNLVIGAFLSTTLPGIIPLVGGLWTILVSSLRGFVIGVTYPEILASSAAGFVIGLGTMILELGAYVFSGAAGIYISLSPIMPKRYGGASRWAAFKIAWRDAARVYVIVMILLALGAVWEMTGILLSLRPS